MRQDTTGYGRIRVLQEYGRIRETPMENQLRDFKGEFSAFQGIGNKVRELESHLGSIKHSFSQYHAMSLRMFKVEGEGAKLNVSRGLLEKLPPPILPIPHVSDVDRSSHHVLGDPTSRVSVPESRVGPLREAYSQSISETTSLRGVIQNINDGTTREMKGIQQRQNDLANSHKGIRSELEVGNLGALVTCVDKISLGGIF